MRVRKNQQPPTEEPNDFIPSAKDKPKRDAARKKRKKKITRRTFEKYSHEARDRLAAWRDDPKAWEGAKPEHLIGLFVIFHLHVYGVEPSDLLEDDTFLGARSSVAALLRQEFLGDANLLAEFIRWTWEREKETEKWYRERGEVRSFHMGWRVQFQSRAHLTKWRVALARKIQIAAR